MEGRLTDGRWNAQHLYFTGSTQTSDARYLVVLGDRDHPARGPYDPQAAVNVFALDRTDDTVARLSANSDGIQRSYVYFGGHDGRGIAPASVALDAENGTVYYLQGASIHRSDLGDGPPSEIARVPRGFVTGYGAVSADGSRYCLPAVPDGAFADLKAIDRGVREAGLSSRVWIFDTSTGRLVEDLEVAGGWVTHVQFHPEDAEVLLLNHEWADRAGERRIWLRDSAGLRPLRRRDTVTNGAPVGTDDYVDHEIWSRDGAWVLYHGTYAPGDHGLAGRSFVGRISLANGSLREVPFLPSFVRYGHFAAGPGNLLVTDGYAEYDAPGTPPRPSPGRFDGVDAPPEDDGGSWISQVEVDWDTGRIDWVPIARHGSSWWSQDAHPHPTFDLAGKTILFTSDREGFRAVYAVPAVADRGRSDQR